MEKLPYDIASQVFFRLPIQSILDCKLVCKAWLSIIKDPYFGLQHEHARQVHDHGYVLLLKDSATSFSLCYQEYGNNYDKLKVESYVPPIKRITRHPTIEKTSSNHSLTNAIIGSCNGLICCASNYDGDPISICNPLTREYLCLPKIVHSRVHVYSGFGYHRSTNAYKVVRIFGARTAVKRVQVYTLGGTSDHGWRDKDDVSYEFCDQRGVLLNEEIYWLCSNKTIVAFNLADETFREIVSLPPSITVSVLYLGFYRLDGCLCVVERLYNHNKVDVWLLRKRGTGNDADGQNSHTWSKEFSVPMVPMPITPLCITECGKLLFWLCGELQCYDPKLNGIVRHTGHSRNTKIIEGIEHINSLVSLKALASFSCLDAKDKVQGSNITTSDYSFREVLALRSPPDF